MPSWYSCTMKPTESLLAAIGISDGLIVGGAAIESYAHLLPQPLYAALLGSAVLMQAGAVAFLALSIKEYRKTL